VRSPGGSSASSARSPAHSRDAARRAGPPRRPSTDEGRPAYVVAAHLIFYHEVSNPAGKPAALPFALDPSRVSAARICSSSGLDRVGGGTEVMLGDMGYAGGLTRGVGREPEKLLADAGLPPSRVRRQRGPASSSYGHRPMPAPRRSLEGARICWLLLLEQVQHVLGAGGGPEGQKLVIGVGERAASADRHQVRVSDGGKDHPHSLHDGLGLNRAEWT
jgi:hypothetical protein